VPREVEIHADPDVWALVPSSIDDALAWIERQVARGPEAARERIADAARLALMTAAGGELSAGLFLCVPEAELYGLLGIVVLDDVPAPDGAEGARGIAEALLPSPWPAEVIAVELGQSRGWRASVLDPEGATGDAVVAVPQTASTAYILDVRGRCAVAALTPLIPLAATAAQVLAERALMTLDVKEATVGR
jgi:hypothetical protein